MRLDGAGKGLQGGAGDGVDHHCHRQLRQPVERLHLLPRVARVVDLRSSNSITEPKVGSSLKRGHHPTSATAPSSAWPLLAC